MGKGMRLTRVVLSLPCHHLFHYRSMPLTHLAAIIVSTERSCSGLLTNGLSCSANNMALLYTIRAGASILQILLKQKGNFQVIGMSMCV